MSFKVMLSPVAVKQLDRMDKKEKERVIKTIRMLEDDPIRSRPKADIRKLAGIKGNVDLYRLRVGDMRVIFEISERTVWISEIVARARAYRFLL